MFKAAVPVWAKKYVGERNVLLSLTADIDFSGKFSSLSIAADTLYRIYINGEFAFHGPQRCGKGTWRIDEIDLTHRFKRNEINKLEIQVLNYGVTSFEYIMQPGFVMAEVKVDDKVVAKTDENSEFTVRLVTSRERKVERYSYQRPFIEVMSLPITYGEPLELVKVENVKFTERTAPYPVFNKIYPEKLIAKGLVTLAPLDHDTLSTDRFENNSEPDFCYATAELNELYRTYGDRLTNTLFAEMNKEIDREYVYDLKNGEFVNLKLNHENTGFFSFEVESESDAFVYIQYDEVLVNGDVYPKLHTNACPSGQPIRMKKGKYTFTSMEPRTMQYIKLICVEGNVKIKSFGLIEYVNSASHNAKFESSDEALNRIYNAAVNTFEQNAVDVFMDCPSRERAGWLCDSFFTARVEKDLTGKSDVERGFLENFFIAADFPRIPEGMLPMCYPSDELSNSFIPNWAMFLVIQLEEYIQRTGDKRMLEISKERIYKLEKYFDGFINDDGLLEGLKGWVFVEWSKANEWVQSVNFPSNMMYYAMLKAMSRMYGDASLDAKAENLKKIINEKSFNGTFFRDHQVYSEGNLVTPEDVTEVCQYYAFFTHIADKENYPELLEIIANDFGAGHKCEKTHPGVYPANAFIGNYLRMEVLSQNGYRKQIIGEIKEYFDYMAKLTGTLWENDSTSASCNHGFASHVIRFIFRDCLGIDKIDEVNGLVYLNNDYQSPENVNCLIPLRNGSIKVTVSEGIRKVDITGDYKLG